MWRGTAEGARREGHSRKVSRIYVAGRDTPRRLYKPGDWVAKYASGQLRCPHRRAGIFGTVSHLEQVIAQPCSQEWSMYPPTPAQRAPLRAHRLPRAPASGTATGLPVRAPPQAVACPGSLRRTVVCRGGEGREKGHPARNAGTGKKNESRTVDLECGRHGPC